MSVTKVTWNVYQPNAINVFYRWMPSKEFSIFRSRTNSLDNVRGVFRTVLTLKSKLKRGLKLTVNSLELLPCSYSSLLWVLAANALPFVFKSYLAHRSEFSDLSRLESCDSVTADCVGLGGHGTVWRSTSFAITVALFITLMAKEGQSTLCRPTCFVQLHVLRSDSHYVG